MVRERLPVKWKRFARIAAFTSDEIIDPIYGLSLTQGDLTDHKPESPLNEEEQRMNRESKLFHRVYNNMAFPDPESAPVRTITATCTRVSRESVIIRAPERTDALRRLTVRERATLQGFPISYEFFGVTYAQKLKMIGNALPPLMSFYISQAMQGTAAGALVSPGAAIAKFVPPNERPPVTVPDGEGRSYPSNRAFRAAVPNLRFKSGVRFELANEVDPNGEVKWEVRFYFGNSKDIKECALHATLLEKCRRDATDERTWSAIAPALQGLTTFVRGIDSQAMQGNRLHWLRHFQ
jgi:DNA (cytosine-5)-methyltransferase 1